MLRLRAAREADRELDALAPPPNPTEQDLAATKIIEAYRRRVWRKLSVTTKVSYRPVLRLLTELVLDIAAVYNRDSERPELGVTLENLVHLARRTTERLEALLDTGPGRTVSDLSVARVYRYYSFVNRMQQREPFKTLIGRPVVRKTFSWVWWMATTVNNWSNPYIWAYRGAKKVAWETSARVILVQIIEFTGIEAMATFSGRSPPQADGRQEEWLLREALHVAALARPLRSDTQRALLQAVLEAKALSSDRRLKLIALLAQEKIPAVDLPEDLLLSPQFGKRLIERVEWAVALQAGGEDAKVERLRHWERLTRRSSRQRVLLVSQLGQNGIRPENARERNREIQRALFVVEAAALQLPGSMRFTPELYDEFLVRGAEFSGAPFSRAEMEDVFTASEDTEQVWRAAAAITAEEDRRSLLARLLDTLTKTLPLTSAEDEWLRELLARWDWSGGRKLYEGRLRAEIPLGQGVSPPDFAFIRYLLSSARPGERFAGALETASEQTVTEADQRYRGKVWLVLTDDRLCITGYGTAESGGLRLFDIATVPDNGRIVLEKKGRFRRPWRYRIDGDTGTLAEFLIPNDLRQNFVAMLRRWNAFVPHTHPLPTLLLPPPGSTPAEHASSNGSSA